MKRIKVLLADDHTVVRQGLRLLLESQRDLSVVGEAEDGRQAVELTGKLKPDVVVMDITMPVLDGLEATRQIMKQAPEMNDAQGYNSLRRSLDLLLGDRNESSRHAREESMRDVWSAVQL